MAQWEAVAGGSLFNTVFSPLAGIAETISNIISPLQTILKIIQTILKIIRMFLLDLANLLIAIIRTLVDEITKFLKELANSGVYILNVAPDFSSTQAFYDSTSGGFDGFVDKVYNSFFDVADAQRPIFAQGEQAGGVVLAVNSGNIIGALNLLALISNGFKTLFQQTYTPPILHGHAGNACNVLFFERPNLPSDLFTSVQYAVQRAETSGGVPKTVSVPSSLPNPVQTTIQPDLDSQTHEQKVDWNTITTITLASSLEGSSQYMIIDGTDTESPQLVKFDLSKRAGLIANPLRDPLNPPTALGPNSFSLNQSSSNAAFTYNGASNQNQIAMSVPSASDNFKKKYINGFWVDVRVNGVSLPNPEEVITSDQMSVVSFDGKTVILSTNVPLGSKVEVWTYVQAKSSDVVSLRDFHAKHPSIYTKKINVGGAVQNEKTYFYRIVAENTEQVTLEDGTTGFPIMSKSNEVRLTPRANVPYNSMRAYCMGSVKGPFAIDFTNNKMDFSVGTNRYQVALRPSILNSFSISPDDFNDKYGLCLNSDFRPTTTNIVQAAIQTGSASNQVLQLLNGETGVTFQYFGSDGRKRFVNPGQLIPVDAEDILLDLQTQCKDGNVRFSLHNGHIVIQDVSGNPSSSITFHAENKALGFKAGTCMSVAYSQPPDWTRYAVKDFIPQIYDLAELIESFANGLISGIESGVQSLVDFIDLISAKIKTLQDFLDKVQKLLNALKNLKVLLPNLYVLKVPIVGGTFALAESIRTAGNRPLSSPDDIAFGITIIAGGFAAPIVVPILHAIL